ncbi:hypothetical protein BX616_008757 [Lobosporangium transversale]|uniref:Eisosome component PIL1-domain-containing protein n=1 Tax=Lobosporangium transversale TaxID=64571 RepID=A0A1Y2GXK9_9FUNG|nr:Eisosome component PIL1-domain-containing protein [Lobosporangium transversale]KAF9914200.1 hypothetical protein BX616_008757 [Lobosporangium transversale]ORZ27016.1 Eisosome component PIL1-domain-containing protein [Lobosporangium transversale]|eukprot:XP_021884763.1 Eisosome component PIL1-domain-containing protein [Lobosporangium transversale]
MQSIGHDLRRGLNNFSLGNYKNINKWLGELKNIDASLKVLDKEITTSAKLISGWGCNEGDDLADVCQRMTQLMEEVGLIHQAYSIQHTAYRKQIKSLKVHEMALDDNRKKKQDLTNQITKHQKSSKENPIKLMELQTALERVSAELLSQELELLQFKRITIRDAFNAQFDSMIEFGEKMALIAGYGRQITNVIDVGPQEANKATLYNGAEYTAAAISQVRIAVTSWQPQPVGNPIRPHVAPSHDELAMSDAAIAYNSRTSPVAYGDSNSQTGSHDDYPNADPAHRSSSYWEEVQMLKSNRSQASGSDYENWKNEINDVANRSDDYISPPDSNLDVPSYTSSPQMSHLQEQQRHLHLEQQRARQQSSSSYSPKPSPSQQHYQNAASTVASNLRHSSTDDYGGNNIGGRPFTPAMLRRSETGDSSGYGAHQHQPTSYEKNMSSSPARSYRLGFADTRERSRMERMDNSDLYKNDIGTSISPRYPRTQVIMDEK